MRAGGASRCEWECVWEEGVPVHSAHSSSGWWWGHICGTLPALAPCQVSMPSPSPHSIFVVYPHFLPVLPSRHPPVFVLSSMMLSTSQAPLSAPSSSLPLSVLTLCVFQQMCTCLKRFYLKLHSTCNDRHLSPTLMLPPEVCMWTKISKIYLSLVALTNCSFPSLHAKDLLHWGNEHCQHRLLWNKTRLLNI